MKKSVLSTLSAAVFCVTTAAAFAQAPAATTTTTTSWTDAEGNAITTYSTSQKYPSVTDPSIQPDVGYVLPGTVTVYPLPETVKVEDPDRYSYSIINRAPRTIMRF